MDLKTLQRLQDWHNPPDSCKGSSSWRVPGQGGRPVGRCSLCLLDSLHGIQPTLSHSVKNVIKFVFSGWFEFLNILKNIWWKVFCLSYQLCISFFFVLLQLLFQVSWEIVGDLFFFVVRNWLPTKDLVQLYQNTWPTTPKTISICSCAVSLENKILFEAFMTIYLQKFLLVYLADTVSPRRISSKYPTVSLLVSPTVFCSVLIVLHRRKVVTPRGWEK